MAYLAEPVVRPLEVLPFLALEVQEVLPYQEAQVVRPLGALPFLALEVLGGRHREVQRHRLQEQNPSLALEA